MNLSANLVGIWTTWASLQLDGTKEYNHFLLPWQELVQVILTTTHCLVTTLASRDKMNSNIETGVDHRSFSHGIAFNLINPSGMRQDEGKTTKHDGAHLGSCVQGNGLVDIQKTKKSTPVVRLVLKPSSSWWWWWRWCTHRRGAEGRILEQTCTRATAHEESTVTIVRSIRGGSALNRTATDLNGREGNIGGWFRCQRT